MDEGLALTVTPLAADDLHADLQGLDDSVLVFAYDLGPDGSTFDEPVSVTFHIDPTEHNLDLPEGALPLLLVLTTNSAGQLEVVGGIEVVNQAGEVVIEVPVDHFSPVVVAVANDLHVRLMPAELGLTVGQIAPVVVERLENDFGFPIEHHDVDDPWDWTAVSPFSIAGTRPTSADVKCESPSDGKVVNAYSVDVPTSTSDGVYGGVFKEAFGNADIFGLRSIVDTIYTLSGDATCTAPAEETTDTTAFVNTAPRSTQNPTNEIDAAGQSGPVAINADDCFDDDGPVDCEPGIDVIGLAWDHADGTPDLLTVTLTFSDPPTDAGEAIIDVGVWPRGDGGPLGVRVSISDGAASCTFPNRDDGPLPGETCEVDGSDIVIVYEISAMGGRSRST